MDAWAAVHGELLKFEVPDSCLTSIYRQEGFRTGGSSLYRLVLMQATVDGACEIAWIYTVGTLSIQQCRIVSGCWP